MTASMSNIAPMSNITPMSNVAPMSYDCRHRGFDLSTVYRSCPYPSPPTSYHSEQVGTEDLLISHSSNEPLVSYVTSTDAQIYTKPDLDTSTMMLFDINPRVNTMNLCKGCGDRIGSSIPRVICTICNMVCSFCLKKNVFIYICLQ